LNRLRVRGEEGVVGGAEGVVFGFLVFVVGTLIIVNAWAVIDAKLAVAGAAREAARAYVESESVISAETAAEAAAEDAIRAQGRTGPVHLVYEGDGFGRCARVTVTARYDVPLGGIPVLAVTKRTFTVSARHSEVVDPFRSSAVGGLARCG
jgi:Flp pilus assembly protein TadG